MKLYKKREKISTGITALSTSGKNLFVGSVDDSVKVLGLDYSPIARLKVNLGTIDLKATNDSLINRTCDKFL